MSAPQDSTTLQAPSTPFFSADPPPSRSPLVPKMSRLDVYREAISREVISFEEISTLASSGIPEDSGVRATYWKILLHHLPLKPASWKQHHQNTWNLYKEWVRELMIDPHKKEASEAGQVRDVTHEDHPLSMDDDSIWKAYFKDVEMLSEIDKDVRRTYPHLHFFNKDGEAGRTRHHEAIRRVLFIYAKLNQGIKYVQGMNEILAPIYFVLASDPSTAEHAEEDSFFCFKNLMGEIMNNFCKSLDHSNVGVDGSMRRMNELLRLKDEALHSHLEKQKMNPQFFSFRWITLLMSQEFELPDVVRLWDSLFADERRFELLYYCCIAMLDYVRDQLLANDFADNLKLLQNFPKDVDVNHILRAAYKLRDGD